MPTYEFLCEPCMCVTTLNVPYSERPDTVPCTFCSKPAIYMMSSPAVMRAAFPDGIRRKGWDKLKEASKLELEAANSKNSTKQEIKREIRKMGIKTSE